MRITNCHIHTFTTRHTPRYFPLRIVAILRMVPWVATFLRWSLSLFPNSWLYIWLVRIENFYRTGNRLTQEDVFKEILFYYPDTARFVVLPMAMEGIGHGPVSETIVQQHDELAALERNPAYKDRVLPFVSINPNMPGARDEFMRCVDMGFRGLKLYPHLGYSPDHDLLMKDIYPVCQDLKLPVMTHCSRGGVIKRGLSRRDQHDFTKPGAFIPVMKEFNDLRVCLAHFGGDSEWRDLLTDGLDPDDPQAREKNWSTHIVQLIRCKDYPNLYTDISYTIFKFASYVPLLRLYMEDEDLRRRILFGSDFYMTRQEQLSEKAVSIRLRDALGEANFQQIAEINPEVWLGERPEAPRTPK